MLDESLCYSPMILMSTRFLRRPSNSPLEDLLPGPEVQLSRGHRNNQFTAHDLTLNMRVGVVLACSVVMVPVDGFVRRQVLEPDLVVVMQSLLVIVDEDRRLMWRCKLCGAPARFSLTSCGC